MGIFGKKFKSRENLPAGAMQDQVVLITGAGGGIAGHVAEHLARAGAKLVLADMDKDAVAARAEALQDTTTAEYIQTVIVDVTKPEECKDAVAKAVEHFGRLDVVWGNAGIAPFEFMEFMDGDKWRAVVDINLKGVYNIVSAALPHIIKTKGYIAMTSSWAAFAHSPGHSAYSSSKAGVEALGNALRSEVDHQGVKVGVFHPGWVDTRMVTDLQKDGSAYNLYLDSLPGPLGDVTTVQEISRVLSVALANRSNRVVHPKPGWFLYVMRACTPLWPLKMSQVKAAPKMRQIFLRELSQKKSK